MQKEKCVVYIGDFDFENENVQSHLVRNNGKVFNRLGYKVFYIGINRNISSFSEQPNAGRKRFDGDDYLELPYTLNPKGLFQYKKVCGRILSCLNHIASKKSIQYVITYQAPSYAGALKKIAEWCRHREIRYLVNCADLPIFSMQPIIRRSIMSLNWRYMHDINKKYADGVIAVSTFVEKFYAKKGCSSVVIPPLFDCGKVCFAKTERSDPAPRFLYAGCPFASLNHEIKPSEMKDRLDYIIDLFAELEKRQTAFKFIIIGIDREDYLTCVPRQKNILENSRNIIFRGKCGHAETLKEISVSDFSINYRDKSRMTEAGMSTKVVESISVGTPVIVNSTSDTFRYLEEGTSGFELTKSFRSNADKLYGLCQLPEKERTRLKIQCLDSKMFDVDTYVTKMDAFLKSMSF